MAMTLKQLLKMLWFIGIAVGIKLCVPMSAQPTACTETSQCSTGFYCDMSVHFCRECISCSELNRESSAQDGVCVTSVVNCGDCLEGFIEDLHITHACVLSTGSSSSTLPWIIGIIVTLLIIFVCPLLYFIIKKRARRDEPEMSMSAEKTPNYSFNPSAPIEDVQASPLLLPNYNNNNHAKIEIPPQEAPPNYEESIAKDNAFTQLPPQRTAEGSQTARAYRPPDYVRVPSDHPMAQEQDIWDNVVSNPLPQAIQANHPPQDFQNNILNNVESADGAGMDNAVALNSQGPRNEFPPQEQGGSDDVRNEPNVQAQQLVNLTINVAVNNAQNIKL